jgi:phosphoserine aminotransferase
MTLQRPVLKPKNPCFSCGPSAKHAGWSLEALKGFSPGRSHRAASEVKKLAEVIERSKAILDMPKDWKLGILPASDTGAFEAAMWSLLGPLPVDVLGWEVFSNMWVHDIASQLKPNTVREFVAPFGKLPDLSQVNSDHDIVFVWNGTTAGVQVPNADWIKSDRKGLVLCDATSALFGVDIPWDKVDVITWSWQKVLGSEAAHGMLALSPRAVARLESYTPSWPMPKLFRLTKNGKVNEEIFEGKTINTPSMLAVEDCLDAMKWVESIGGLPVMLKRSKANLTAVEAWVEKTDWAAFLSERTDTRSNAIVIKVTDPWFTAKDAVSQRKFIKDVEKTIEKEGAGFETANHIDAPPSFRIWTGPVVETADVEAVLNWIDWGYRTLKAEQAQSKAA